MNKRYGTSKEAAEKLVRDIKRKTRQHYSAEEKIGIVLAAELNVLHLQYVVFQQNRLILLKNSSLIGRLLSDSIALLIGRIGDDGTEAGSTGGAVL